MVVYFANKNTNRLTAMLVVGFMTFYNLMKLFGSDLGALLPWPEMVVPLLSIVMLGWVALALKNHKL